MTIKVLSIKNAGRPSENQDFSLLSTETLIDIMENSDLTEEQQFDIESVLIQREADKRQSEALASGRRIVSKVVPKLGNKIGRGTAFEGTMVNEKPPIYAIEKTKVDDFKEALEGNKMIKRSGNTWLYKIKGLYLSVDFTTRLFSWSVRK